MRKPFTQGDTAEWSSNPGILTPELHLLKFISYNLAGSMPSYHNDVIFVKYYAKRGFPGDSVVKNSPANGGDPGSIPGLGRFLEEKTATHSSILARIILWTEEPGRLWSMELHFFPPLSQNFWRLGIRLMYCLYSVFLAQFLALKGSQFFSCTVILL